MMRVRLLALMWVLAAGGCRATAPATSVTPPAPAGEAATAGAVHLTLIGTNDLHGWVMPHETVLADGTVIEEGGAAALGGYVKALRAQNPDGTLLLDSGDLFQGTLAANLTEGAVVIEAMNAMGYTAAALGNHEFDYGPSGPSPVVLEPGGDPFGALKERLAQAKFPILALNVYEAATGRRPDWLGNPGWLIVEKKGVKVGLVGLITPTTPQVTNPVNVATLRFGALAPEAIRGAKLVREAGADVVIGVVHAGGKCESAADPRDLSSCDPAQEIFEMLAAVPPGTLDAVLAGHTHGVLAHYVNGTPVIESGGMGKSFAIMDLWVDPRTRKPRLDRTRMRAGIPVCERVEAATGTCEGKKLKTLATATLIPATFLGQPVTVDAEVARAIAPTMARVEELQQKPLGLSSPQKLGRRYEAESALGSFLADVLREMEGADIALLNSGGLRADLPAGDIRYGDFYEVIPFDNTVATLTLTGEELARLLEAAFSAKKGVFQQSGLRLLVSQCPGEDRLKSATLANGQPIDPKATYKVVMPDFLARGGDGFAPVTSRLPPERVDLGESRLLNFRDALVNHIRTRRADLLPPKPGRTRLLDDAAACAPGSNLDLHALSR